MEISWLNTNSKDQNKTKMRSLASRKRPKRHGSLSFGMKDIMEATGYTAPVIYLMLRDKALKLKSLTLSELVDLVILLRTKRTTHPYSHKLRVVDNDTAF